MVAEILARRVAFPSVGTPNGPIAGWIADQCPIACLAMILALGERLST